MCARLVLLSAACLVVMSPREVGADSLSPARRVRVGENARGVAWSPDGKLVAVVSGDDRKNTIRLWDVSARKFVRDLEGPDGFGCRLAFAPEGKLLAAGGKTEVCVWEAGSGKLLYAVGVKSSDHGEVAYSPDGRLLATGDGLICHLRRAATGRVVRRINLLPPTDNETTFPVCFSPDGKRLATCGGRGYHVWDVATGEPLHSGKGMYACHGFSPDGRLLAMTKDLDFSVRMVDAATGRIRYRCAGYTSTVWGVAFSPDGNLLVAADANHRFLLWEVATGKPVLGLRGHRDYIAGTAFSPDGRFLAAACGDGDLLLWNLVPDPDGKDIRPEELKQCWADLGGRDAGRAFRAVRRLAAAPEKALAFLGKRLKPAPPGEGDHIRKRIADLDDDRFAVREAANKELEALGHQAEPALRQALTKKPSLELRRRVEALLERLERAPFHIPGDEARRVRTVAALEHIASPPARALLRRLAAGAAEARLTQQARAALRRLEKRAAKR